MTEVKSRNSSASRSSRRTVLSIRSNRKPIQLSNHSNNSQQSVNSLKEQQQEEERLLRQKEKERREFEEKYQGLPTNVMNAIMLA